MTQVTLVQCTNSKQDTKAQAKNLYSPSSYFEAMRRWAEARGDPWYILSAKHGLVDPREMLEPYDERGISDSQAETIATQLHEDNVKTVHITAGSDYTEPLVPELEAKGIDVVNHFAGERIAIREKKLTIAARKLENHTL